jgi:energy-coupling factor transporter ATP-binding protein EcfA2
MIEVPESFNYLEINDEMQKAFDIALNTNENLIITGPAGVGKSEFISVLQELTQTDFGTIYLAPTGVASVRVKGQTIHSFFKFPPTILKGEDLNVREDYVDLMCSLERIVIDEISFVSSNLLDAIDQLLQQYRDNDKPFGGVQMILIGDLYQLPPVVKENSPEQQYMTDVYGGYFFFHAYGFRSGNFNKIIFHKIYRQKNKDFSDVLNNIRVGNFTDTDLKFINKRIVSEDLYSMKKKDYIYLASYNRVVNNINKKFLNKIPSTPKKEV